MRLRVPPLITKLLVPSLSDWVCDLGYLRVLTGLAAASQYRPPLREQYTGYYLQEGKLHGFGEPFGSINSGPFDTRRSLVVCLRARRVGVVGGLPVTAYTGLESDYSSEISYSIRLC